MVTEINIQMQSMSAYGGTLWRQYFKALWKKDNHSVGILMEEHEIHQLTDKEP